MDIKQCPNYQKQFDQDKRLSKQLPCGCVSCLKCYKTVFQLAQKTEYANNQKVYNSNPEELQDYVIQEPSLKDLLQPYDTFIDQEKINEQFRQLQDQYFQKQNHKREIMKVIQNSSQFFQHIQSLSIKEILRILIDQFSMSNVKIENLLKRLSGFQVTNKVYQQQQALILDQKDPHLNQNPQGQLQQQFQQILSEIEELKKDQWMDVQSLRVNIQRCMFNLFVYLRDNSSDQLLIANKAESLVQKYFKQNKVQNSLSQGSSSLVHQKSQFQSQHSELQLIQEIQNIDQQQQQYQNQVIDKYQGQDLVQEQQFLVQKEISLQKQQVIDVRIMFQQLEQNLINFTNNFSFNNHVNQLCQEQESLIKYVPCPPLIITFDNLMQFLNQIKDEKVSLQTLKFSLLNKSGLIEQEQILYQLPQVTDQ